MSVSLGKRKRSTKATAAAPLKKVIIAPPPPEAESDGEDKEALQDAFRRAFEARFKPIEDEKEKEEKVIEETQEDMRSEDEDDWDGLPEDGEEDEEDEVEVVEHANTAYSRDRADKATLRAFMSHKPPTETSTPQPSKGQKPKTSDATNETDTNEADDLKNDLALQRLLKESHLLTSDFSHTDPTGKNRHKATDLRLLDLGSKSSIFTQKNMPKSHRQGIAKKGVEREESRRREARENGIVLERFGKGGVGKGEGRGGAAAGKRRERNVGAPSVGRFGGATLRLSKRDVEGITGPKVSSSRGGKGKGRGGKRR